MLSICHASLLLSSFCTCLVLLLCGPSCIVHCTDTLCVVYSVSTGCYILYVFSVVVMCALLHCVLYWHMPVHCVSTGSVAVLYCVCSFDCVVVSWQEAESGGLCGAVWRREDPPSLPGGWSSEWRDAVVCAKHVWCSSVTVSWYLLLSLSVTFTCC